MFVRIETRNDVKILALGMFIGGNIVFRYVGKYHRKVVFQYREADRAKTDLINWLTENADKLDVAEIQEEFEIRRKFLNIVLK